MPRQFKVTVNGREYDVSVLELTAGSAQQTAAPAAGMPVAAAGSATSAAPAAPAAAAPAGAAGAAGDIVAGMGGVVVEVLVKVGQTVAAGDRVLVLEAMKMKTPVIATSGGQVTRVLVAPGDPVEGGQALVTIA
ncbi:MAG: acetyl-CoA carboxylase biotin carboxyl carrier protein subunit [Candidatus Accumulibacter sp.]|jgi:biotin carboxyl carrier protein|uniref:Acetyl-CoA carboxylase biotin carboxyl carrier protein subunit n=1 Tax=Candidatus Accumulibacter affinis TaxID=2954384 RepID=A0A935T4N5_9PROT|nr:acetyl-CoA carboxylase biotin carboxyl carrier protein subunit [Candidatus Accumulibacter affinis]MBP9806256.1 acetyl-CoA carboxylase biotin carboxyl carrier protein subunit [Accumulibacter sp.]